MERPCPEVDKRGTESRFSLKQLYTEVRPAVRIPMEYIYAALLLHKMGKPVDEANLTSVVKATGAEPDSVKIKALASALSEVNIDEALKNAATMAAAAPAAAAAAPGAPAAKAEEKPKEEEKKEEEALQGLASLFG